MTTVSVRGERAGARGRPLVDRLLAVFPAAAVALAVLALYLVEAWSRKTPWIFTDELEWTQISRSIAATGHAARRGQPIFFKSIYAYLIAPAWWLHGTSTPYAAIKYANAVIMSLAAVPVYLTSRLLVTRRTAVLVAAAAVVVPGMAYVTSIVPDVLAYPYFALCSWLVIRALTTGRRLHIVLAAAFTICGYFVHQREFTLLPAAFAIAGAALWFTGPRGRALRRNWSRGDTVGFFALLLGAAFLFNHVVLGRVQEWHTPTEYYKNLMINLGLDAALSLTIGLGALPVIAGLASLWLPERRGDPAYRAFVAWTAAVVALLGLYAADKAAYLSTQFATLWEERPMIFLSPLLLLGAALVLEAKRINRLAFGAATAFVLVLVLFKQIQTGWPYYEAPGSALAGVLHSYEGWNGHDLRLGLLGVTAVSIALLLLRRRPGVAAVAVALSFAWLLSGEIGMTVGIDHAADTLHSGLPVPLDWIDQATHGQPATYLEQGVQDPNGENLTEFWNRSIHTVGSLSGQAPGPGPTTTPAIVSPDGRLSGITTPYVVADTGVTLAEPVVARPSQGSLVLYRSDGPWRLLDSLSQVYPDTWCTDWCAYTYFVPHRGGSLVVTVGRSGYGGNAPAAQTTLRVGAVKIDRNGNPELGRIERTVHVTVHNAAQQVVRIPLTQTPVRVEVSVPDADLIPPSGGESRSLGVQVGFRIVPK